MSQQEFTRFRADLRSDAELRRFLQDYPAGPAAVVDLGAVIELLSEAAIAAGYDVSPADVKAMLKRLAAQLSLRHPARGGR